eukprot:479871-Amphidinium_carterae.1
MQFQSVSNTELCSPNSRPKCTIKETNNLGSLFLPSKKTRRFASLGPATAFYRSESLGQFTAEKYVGDTHCKLCCACPTQKPALHDWVKCCQLGHQALPKHAQ